jgi:hypothetical protein
MVFFSLNAVNRKRRNACATVTRAPEPGFSEGGGLAMPSSQLRNATVSGVILFYFFRDLENDMFF